MRDHMRTRRQLNRTGGPSGTSAMASIGSGRSNRRIGRVGARESCREYSDAHLCSLPPCGGGVGRG